MNPASTKNLLIIIALICNHQVMSQQRFLYYKLVKANDSVGEMTVTENRTEVMRTIKTTTKVVVPTLLIDIVMEDNKHSEFHNQVLQSATIARKFFNSNPQQSTTVKSGEIYTDGHRPIPSLHGTKEIIYSSTMLYTTEPLYNTRIYSEYHHQFMTVKRIADHVYCIRYPDQTCSYYYEKGICVRIVTETTWAIVESILISQNLAHK